MNADGFDDLVVGAPGSSASGLDSGVAYLFLGGDPMDPVADRSFVRASGDRLGSAVAGADVDDDGFSDLIVGAPADDPVRRGRVLLYRGGPGVPDGTHDQMLEGTMDGDRFGAAVAAVGDADGDGYVDVLVGAPGWNGMGFETGRASLYVGRPSGQLVLAGHFNGQLAGDRFGATVAGAGDVNADGFDDLLVGAPDRSTFQPRSGRVYLYHGAPFVDGGIDAQFTGQAAHARLGVAATGAGDLDGDGFGDVVIGAERSSSLEGAVFVYFGEAWTDESPDRVVLGTTADDRLGAALGAGADFDADGVMDILLGAPGQGLGGEVIIADVTSAFEDCNDNGVGDACDIADGTSLDENGNGIPDECEPLGAPVVSPTAITLSAVTPSPTIGEARLELRLSRTAPVELTIFDARGRSVAVLHDGVLVAGSHTFRWSGRSRSGAPVGPGVYYFRLTAADRTWTRQLLRIR